MAHANDRPVFLNLLRIHMPVTAVTSIGHRLSGILLFALLPVALYLFELSVCDAAGFERASAILASWPFRLAGILGIGWLGHHLLAGIRLLLADLDIGTDLPGARRGAWAVNAGGVLILLIAAFFLL